MRAQTELEKTGLIIKERRLVWFGRRLRMDEHRLQGKLYTSLGSVYRNTEPISDILKYRSDTDTDVGIHNTEKYRISTIKVHLDQFWAKQEVMFDWTADLVCQFWLSLAITTLYFCPL